MKPKREKLFADVDEEQREIYYAADMDRWLAEEVLPVLRAAVVALMADGEEWPSLDALIQQITEET